MKRQIKSHLTASVFALDNGPDICSVDEQLHIFNEMQCCIDKIMHLNNRLKGEAKPVAETAVKKKASKQKPDRPAIDEVNNYLKSHITDEHCYNTLMATSIEEAGNDLRDMAKQLKDTNDRADGSILQVYHILGSRLNSAKERFKNIKDKQKWGQWINENVGLSSSHCSKIAAVADLLTRFPKLRNLKGVSFTKIYNLRKEIKELFSNEDIANNWPDELCVTCCTQPVASSGFVSCEHGVHYCKSCITELMKQRKTEVEVILDDGQIDRFIIKIPGRKCPECRKEIVLPPKPVTHGYNLRPRRK
jgi:hypothetical protein